LPVGASQQWKIEMGDSRAAQSCRGDLLCLLFRNEAVSTTCRLQLLGFAFLLAVVAREIMALLMTAGVNDPLFHGCNDGCSWFVRNGNESDRIVIAPSG
jgi:hypothetical protein